MTTLMETPTSNWDNVLNDADVPGPELVRLLVEVYSLTPEDANTIVTRWLYSDAT